MPTMRGTLFRPAVTVTRLGCVAVCLGCALLVTACKGAPDAPPADAAPGASTEDEEDSGPKRVEITEENGAYSIAGPYNLEARLDRDEEAWMFAGSFTFPTGGYTVNAPLVQVLKRLPEHCIITFTVIAPDPDAMVTQAITVEPFEVRLALSSEATFEIAVRTADDAS